MKHLLPLLLLFLAALTSNAQTIVGDVNHDNSITISDVCGITDILLEKSTPEKFHVTIINDAESDFVVITKTDGSNIEISLNDVKQISFVKNQIPLDPTVSIEYTPLQAVSTTASKLFSTTRLGYIVKNSGLGDIVITKAHFIESNTGYVRKILNLNSTISPGSELLLEFNTGASAMYPPICEVTFLYLGKEYTIQHIWK